MHIRKGRECDPLPFNPSPGDPLLRSRVSRFDDEVLTLEHRDYGARSLVEDDTTGTSFTGSAQTISVNKEA